MANPQILIRNLNKVYSDNGIYTPALYDINMHIQAKAFAVIMGKSGSGKSTLLHLLGALNKPTSGSIEIGNYIIDSNATDIAMAEYRQKTIGFIFQSFHLISNMTVLDNVAFPLQLVGINRIEREKKARVFLEEVGLSSNLFGHLVNKLSGGERQRVAIARSLINDPQIILADEPTGNLDTETGKKIIDLLMKFCNIGKTVIMVTHDKDFQEKATQVFRIEDGRLIQSL